MAQVRLERLDPVARKVLRAASIYGEVFSAEGVSALVGEEPSALEPILDALVEHEAIARSEDPTVTPIRALAFRHVFLRGAAYATLTEEDRALGHRLAAQWLEEKTKTARSWRCTGSKGAIGAARRRALRKPERRGWCGRKRKPRRAARCDRSSWATHRRKERKPFRSAFASSRMLWRRHVASMSAK